MEAFHKHFTYDNDHEICAALFYLLFKKYYWYFVLSGQSTYQTCAVILLIAWKKKIIKTWASLLLVVYTAILAFSWSSFYLQQNENWITSLWVVRPNGKSKQHSGLKSGDLDGLVIEGLRSNDRCFDILSQAWPQKTLFDPQLNSIDCLTFSHSPRVSRLLREFFDCYHIKDLVVIRVFPHVLTQWFPNLFEPSPKSR